MKTSASVFFSLAAFVASANAGELWVSIDHARLYKTDQQIGSIIVGNPGVTDVTVKSPTEIILFGVMPGTTNVALYSPEGEAIETLSIVVRNPSANRLTLQSGIDRYTFACTNVCEQVPAIGDGSNDSRAAPTNVTSQANARLAAARQAVSNNPVGVPVQPTDPYPTEDAQMPPAQPANEEGRPGS